MARDESKVSIALSDIESAAKEREKEKNESKVSITLSDIEFEAKEREKNNLSITLSDIEFEAKRREKEKMAEEKEANPPDTDQHGESSRPPEDLVFTEHYLTFDTLLPNPSEEVIDDSIGPELPDLKYCVSPVTWSKTRKTLTTWLCCATTTLAAYAAGSYGPPVNQITGYFGVSQIAGLAGITTYTTGFAIAPMVLAPFSELRGRKPIFLLSGLVFFACQLSCGLTRSFAGLLVARFWAGVGSSTFSTMVGGVISDIYSEEERNTPMALFAGAVLFATGLGPLCSGFITQALGWRWVFYSQTIYCFVVLSMVAIFFRESRGPVLLSQKAKLLNKWMRYRETVGYYGFEMPVEGEGRTVKQRIIWKVKSDEERETLAKTMWISVYRPFHLLFTEPVVFWFSLWVSFAWAVLYLTFAAVPLVFKLNHGFDIEHSGTVFSAMCIGSILATILSIYQEKIARRCGKRFDTPEGRLYFACVESALLPIGLFWFGWTSFPHVHWIVPTIAIGCATMGIFSIYLAVFNYIADTYRSYASSALAAQGFCRNILASVFPLVTDDLFLKLGTPFASTVLGMFAGALTVVPWILVFYGPRIRARSRFASNNARVKE